MRQWRKGEGGMGMARHNRRMSSFPPPPSAFPPPRIAIIGGGISGLAAAHRLTELLPQAEIELFEAADRLGGVLHTVKRGGFLIEQSADNFLVKPPPGSTSAGQLGIAGDLLTTDESRRRAFVVRSGKLIPIPEGFYLMSPRKLWPLLTSPVAQPRRQTPPARRTIHSTPADAPLNPEPSTLNAQPRRKHRLIHPPPLGPRGVRATRATARRRHLHGRSRTAQHGRHHAAVSEYERTTAASSAPRCPLRTGRFSDQLTDDATDPTNAASGARYGLFVAPEDGMTSLVNALADRLPRDANPPQNTGLDDSVRGQPLAPRIRTRRHPRHYSAIQHSTPSSFALPAHAAANVVGAVRCRHLPPNLRQSNTPAAPS